MRAVLTACCLLTLAACNGGEPTCEKLELPDTIGDYYEVDLSNANGNIHVDFVPGTAAEVWLEDDTNAVVWQVLCDTPEDMPAPPACLGSGLRIGSNAPDGASNPVETQDLKSETEYTAWVADYDGECAGQIRRGASDPFTVTFSAPF